MLALGEKQTQAPTWPCVGIRFLTWVPQKIPTYHIQWLSSYFVRDTILKREWLTTYQKSYSITSWAIRDEKEWALGTMAVSRRFKAISWQSLQKGRPENRQPGCQPEQAGRPNIAALRRNKVHGWEKNHVWKCYAENVSGVVLFKLHLSKVWVENLWANPCLSILQCIQKCIRGNGVHNQGSWLCFSVEGYT